MRRYRFSLAQVQRVRRIEEDVAKAALVDANRRVAHARGGLASSAARYAEVGLVLGAASTSQFLAARQSWQRAADDVVAAEHRLEAATDTATERRDGYLAASRRTEVLDRLDERRREEHALAAARDEEREADDIVVGRAGRAR